MLVPATLTDGGLALTVELGLLAGDFNDDGTVDAADYTVWRDGNSPIDGVEGYNIWQANFGASIASSSSATSEAVPEPSTFLLVVLSGLAISSQRIASKSRK